MIPALIDTGALVKLLYTSLIAGVSVAVIFSVAILGATRSGDLRREGRTGAATAYAVLGGVALALSIGIVIVGLILVAHKS
jgi:Na+/H+-dicarboxylate symporter